MAAKKKKSRRTMISKKRFDLWLFLSLSINADCSHASTRLSCPPREIQKAPNFDPETETKSRCHQNKNKQWTNKRQTHPHRFFVYFLLFPSEMERLRDSVLRELTKPPASRNRRNKQDSLL